MFLSRFTPRNPTAVCLTDSAAPHRTAANLRVQTRSSTAWSVWRCGSMTLPTENPHDSPQTSGSGAGFPRSRLALARDLVADYTSGCPVSHPNSRRISKEEDVERDTVNDLFGTATISQLDWRGCRHHPVRRLAIRPLRRRMLIFAVITELLENDSGSDVSQMGSEPEHLDR